METLLCTYRANKFHPNCGDRAEWFIGWEGDEGSEMPMCGMHSMLYSESDGYTRREIGA